MGTGDSPEIGEMSPEMGPVSVRRLGISEESHARRNRKTTWLASLGASFLFNENCVETGQIRHHWLPITRTLVNNEK